MIAGVIFDLDGVLVATEEIQWNGWVEMLKPLNVGLSRENYKKYAGKRGDIIAAELIEDLRLQCSFPSLLEKKEAWVRKYVQSNPVALLPYAFEILTELHGRGLKVGVASGSPAAEVSIKLNSASISKFFDSVTAGDETRRGKPDPDIYVLALKKMGIPAAVAVAVEDTEYGLRSAKGAGLRCVAVPGEFSIQQDFSIADIVVKDLAEAEKWIVSRLNDSP